MCEFTEGDREYLREMRALSTDQQGREVLVGLTLEETIRYMSHLRGRLEPGGTRDDTDDYLRLHDKHEAARVAVIVAESQARNERPTLQ